MLVVVLLCTDALSTGRADCTDAQTTGRAGSQDCAAQSILSNSFLLLLSVYADCHIWLPLYGRVGVWAYTSVNQRGWSAECTCVGQPACMLKLAGLCSTVLQAGGCAVVHACVCCCKSSGGVSRHQAYWVPAHSAGNQQRSYGSWAAILVGERCYARGTVVACHDRRCSLQSAWTLPATLVSCRVLVVAVHADAAQQLHTCRHCLCGSGECCWVCVQDMPPGVVSARLFAHASVSLDTRYLGSSACSVVESGWIAVRRVCAVKLCTTRKAGRG